MQKSTHEVYVRVCTFEYLQKMEIHIHNFDNVQLEVSKCNVKPCDCLILDNKIFMNRAKEK